MSSLFEVYSRNIFYNNSVLQRVKRLGIKFFLNSYIPVYYRTKRKYIGNEINVIVSFTTFPQRINRAWIIVESMLNQTLRPKKIILTLSKKQFSSEKILPKKLIELENKGLLEIIWTDEDLRSHKKYFYAMKRYPNEIIVTIDDDVIYEKRMLEVLYNYHTLYPECIIANTAVKKNGENYNDWKSLAFSFKSPCYDIMPLGLNGVLYPPHSLHSDAFNIDAILEECPSADDIWLNTMGVINSIKTVKTDYNIYPIPLLFKSNHALYKENVFANKNNEQIKKIIGKYGFSILG